MPADSSLRPRPAYDCRVTGEPSVLLELHSADRLVRTLVMEEMGAARATARTLSRSWR
jgi:hypothetical protein